MNRTTWRNRVLLLGLVVCLAVPVIAQTSAPAPLPSGRRAPEQPTAGPALQQRMKTRISVDFREAPIEDVIKSLAEQADIDIVKGPAVTGTVTATLTDVPLDEAMESIFSVHGFGYTTSESIVRIIPKAELVAVQADADQHPQVFLLHQGFTEDTGHLLPVHEQVVGPFQLHGQSVQSLDAQSQGQTCQ